MKFNQWTVFLFIFTSFSAISAEEIIKRKNYTLNYNEDHEIANWVSYELDHTKLQNCAQRTDNFRADPMISTGSAVNSDYKDSGYDRGHLLPAGDMKLSKEAMSETFFFSNMTPQPSKFNRGRWSQLENLMRSWGSIYKKIWIVTGPVIVDNLAVIGQKNKISVPEQYFKVIIRQKNDTYEGIAFLMGTDVPFSTMKEYATTINEVEDLTGFDFFSFLDNRTEEVIEESTSLKNWDFSGKFEYFPCRASESQLQKSY